MHRGGYRQPRNTAPLNMPPLKIACFRAKSGSPFWAVTKAIRRMPQALPSVDDADRGTVRIIAFACVRLLFPVRIIIPTGSPQAGRAGSNRTAHRLKLTASSEAVFLPDQPSEIRELLHPDAGKCFHRAGSGHQADFHQLPGGKRTGKGKPYTVLPGSLTVNFHTIAQNGFQEIEHCQGAWIVPGMRRLGHIHLREYHFQVELRNNNGVIEHRLTKAGAIDLRRHAPSK